MGFKEDLNNIKKAIADIHNIAVDKVLINYEGVLKQRVFNDAGAENSEDVKLGAYKSSAYRKKRASLNSEDAKLGAYKSSAYRKKRASLGRSTSSINLSFSGELERSIKLVNIDDDRALGVTPVAYVASKFYSKPSANTEQVSNYIDQKFKEVFEPTKEEIADNNKFLDRIIEEEFDKLKT